MRARYYNQEVGRFTQMDTWMGDNYDPITLHKYLYTNADPANMVDPSGHFGLASISAGQNISSVLATSAIASVAILGGLSAADASLEGGISGAANRVGNSVYAVVAYMQVKSEADQKAQELSTDVQRAVAVSAASNSWHAHHTVPIYMCGAVNQSPNMVPLKAPFHTALHSSLRIYSEFLDSIYGAAFDPDVSIFDHTSSTNRNGLKILAQTQVGRSFISNHLSAFYSTGWYAGNANFKPRFEAEKNLFINNPSRNSVPYCRR